MGSRERKKGALQHKSSNYMEEDNMKQESSTSSQNEFPMVRVKTLERGFVINVFSEKNRPGMLVSVLEAFEELGLDVIDARVSCEDTFQLEAVGASEREERESIDAQVVKQTVEQAINNVME